MYNPKGNNRTLIVASPFNIIGARIDIIINPAPIIFCFNFCFSFFAFVFIVILLYILIMSGSIRKRALSYFHSSAFLPCGMESSSTELTIFLYFVCVKAKIICQFHYFLCPCCHVCFLLNILHLYLCIPTLQFLLGI